MIIRTTLSVTVGPNVGLQGQLNIIIDCFTCCCYRATGVAISMVAARFGGIVGNIVIASLLDMYCPAPTFIVAALLIGKYLPPPPPFKSCKIAKIALLVDVVF